MGHSCNDSQTPLSSGASAGRSRGGGAYLLAVALSLLAVAYRVERWNEVARAVGVVLAAGHRGLVDVQGVRALEHGVPAGSGFWRSDGVSGAAPARRHLPHILQLLLTDRV